MSNDWRAAQMNEIKRELKKYPNIRFLSSDANGNVENNIADIENMVSQGAQLLFLAPRNPDIVSLIASKLHRKGVKIVLLTRKLNTNDYDTYISPDDFQIAYSAAIFLAEHLHGRGKILMLEGIPTTTTAIRRKKGFYAGIENFPGIQVISKVANYSRSEAIHTIEAAHTMGLKYNAIYAHNDAMAIGSRLALKKMGINPATVPIVSIDFLPEVRNAILNGEQLASFTYPTCGKEGVEAALKLLQGKKVSRYIRIPSQLVTKENANEVETAY